MKHLILIGLLALYSPIVYGAFSINDIWEIEPVSGSDNNGCGWDAASSGSDFTTSIIQTFNGTSITCTSVGAGTYLTCSGDSPNANQVGNTLHTSGGTNVIAPYFFRITAINTGTHVYTTDRNVTSGAAAALTGVFGGPCQTPYATFISSVASGNAIYFKDEAVFSISSTVVTQVAGSITATTAPNRWIGYTTSRSDRGRARFQLVTTATAAFTLSLTAQSVENFDIDCNNLSVSTGILVTVGGAATEQILNVKIRNGCGGGINSTSAGTVSISSTEVTGVIGNAAITASAGTLTEYFNNWIHDNTATGINQTSPMVALWNVISNNTGATSDGLRVGSITSIIAMNTIHGSGRDNIRSSGASFPNNPVSIIKNNLLTSPGEYNFVGGNLTAGTGAAWRFDGNAYNLGPGVTNRFDLDDTGTGNKSNAIGTYTNNEDVIMSTDPYVNVAGNDFRLNSLATSGAMAKYSGFPPSVVGLSQSGYPDFGAYQTKPQFGYGD